MTGRDYIFRPGDAHNRDRWASIGATVRQMVEGGQAAIVKLGPWESKRSNEANRLMWALLSDLSEQVQWPVDGRLVQMSPEEWKDVMTAGLSKHQRVAAGIEGGFVMLGQRTSKMNVGQMAELITLIEAFGAEHGVKFREPPVLRELGK